jgi:hypothetical protein
MNHELARRTKELLQLAAAPMFPGKFACPKGRREPKSARLPPPITMLESREAKSRWQAP